MDTIWSLKFHLYENGIISVRTQYCNLHAHCKMSNTSVLASSNFQLSNCTKKYL